MADHIDARDARLSSKRREQVDRWVTYIETHPVDVWGPQLNAIVDGQLRSARAADVDADTRARIQAFADERSGRD